MINDLPKRITSHAALYADDFCCWECGCDITLLNQLCQRSLTKMCKWCEDCGFKRSSTKSAAVLFTRKHNPEPTSLDLQDGTRLPLKKEYKYLGLTFQRNGSYSTQYRKLWRNAGLGSMLLGCWKVRPGVQVNVHYLLSIGRCLDL